MKQALCLIGFICTNLLSGQDERWVEPSSIDTSLVLSEITVTLSPGKEQDIEPYILPADLLDSLTKGIQNTHKYSRAIEQYKINQSNTRVRRDGEGLSLKLDNGDWLLMKIDTRTDEVDNVFEYYFDAFGFYSIRVQWGEGNGYKLVSAETGTVSHIIGRPFFSPDGSKIIALGNDIEAGYSENGFQILENKAGKIREFGRFSPDSWGCESAIWLSNNQLLLKNQSLESKNSSWNYFTFYTVLEIK